MRYFWAMERELFSYGLIIWLAVAAGCFVILQFHTAPYGRHTRPGWGPTLHRSAGWAIMEAPAVFVVLFFYLFSERRGNPAAVIFLMLWLWHYLNRAFVYPWRLRGGQLRMPLSIVAMAFFFNLMNGYFQGRYLFTWGPMRHSDWFYDPRFLLGLILFLGGFWFNQQADAALHRLRKPGESGYKIPHGGAYRLVSCPNYLGELIEWLGWALLTWSLSGLVFFLWSVANLLPRARAHHRWYRQQFPDYPRQRRVVIPFLY